MPASKTAHDPRAINPRAINPRAIGLASVAAWCVSAGLLLTIHSAGWLKFDHLLAQAFGCVAITIALLGLLPLTIAFGGGENPQSSQVVGGVMLSIATRSTLTILFAILMWKMDTAPRQTVGLWTIFWYATLLTTEVIVVVRFLFAHNRPTLLTDVSVNSHVTESAAR